jgi:hypothetical protein
MERQTLKSIMLGMAFAGMVVGSLPLRADDEILSLNDLNKKVADLQKANDKFTFTGGGVDLRYDQQEYPTSTVYAKAISQTASAAKAGIYAKRGELDFAGKLMTNVKWVAIFDFTDTTFKDLGMVASKIPMLPGLVDGDDLGWTLQVGQFRQKFGVEQQTGSFNLPLEDRAMFDGGPNPWAAVKNKVNNPYTAVPSKLMGERGIGVHALVDQPVGAGVKVQYGISVDNDVIDGGEAAGQDNITGGWPKQTSDTQLSVVNRLGVQAISSDYLGLNVGGSYAHDPQDTQQMTTGTANVVAADISGADIRIDTLKKALMLQAEFDGYTVVNGKTGAGQRAEGWYAEGIIEPLKLVSEDLPRFQLIGRYEKDMPNVNSKTGTIDFDAATAGVRVIYFGNCHTAFNYTTYGVAGNFNRMPDANFLTIQQQVTF